ncbi:unnamed protein product, partial [Ectocarpus sp. 12 AP-2014]
MLSADGRRELGYTWFDVKMHAALVSGWLPRDPIVGCDPNPYPIHRGDDEGGHRQHSDAFEGPRETRAGNHGEVQW